MTFNNHFDLPPHASDLDSKPPSNIFDDLDSTLIDHNMISPASTERKDSFPASSTTFFSSQTGTNPWGDEFNISASSNSTSHHDRTMSMSSHFGDQAMHSNNPFLQNQQFSNTWVYDRPSGTKTPMSATYEPFNGEFDATTSSAFPSVSTASAFGNGMPLMANVRPSAIMQPAVGSVPLSASPPPQTSKEWMALAEQDLDSGRLPKRIRQSSPSRPLTPGFARRDGVRKKNARFEIPEGRNLHNIDRLIEQATTEDDVKELKQQKRLLRNRQAALDSRQRKKKHTEELEKEQKAWHEHRSDLEVKVVEIEQQLAALRMHKEQIEQANIELQQQVHALTHEKETMIEQHTIETGDLRKRINILTERIEHSPSSNSSTEFVDFANELDHLSMSGWDNFMVDDIIDEVPTKLSATEQTTTLVVGKPRSKDAAEDAQPVASGGFLLMLLLYGAIVASKNNGATAPPMPGMSDEMRVASAHIVDNILKDGNTGASNALVQATRTAGLQAAPSMPAWIQPDNKVSTINTDNLFASPSRPGSVNAFASQLMQQTKDAEAEAAFGLTPSQYNSLTSTDFGTRQMYMDESDDPSESPNNRRKTLADTLRIMREEARGGSVSDVYTRSLLWDRIPDQVLQDFRRMVGDRAKESAVKEEMTT